MIVTNQLVSINFSGLTGTLPTTWDLTPTYPNGALDTTHITARSKTGSADWTGWTAITAFDNDTNIATWAAPSGATQVEFRRSTPRYSVYLDPLAPTSRVSQRNLQVNADQGLYTAIEWAAQFGINAQAPLLPAPGSVPNTLGLQQQTQNYWTAADYSTHVWNFSFAGGYIDRSHVKAQVLLSTGWVGLSIDTADGDPQYNYELAEDGTLELDEDGLIEAREGVTYDNDPNTNPFRFIGPYQLYMDFSVLAEVPQALIIYRHTPRNVKVSSPVDRARITSDGMDPSAQHALFVAVELGEQLSQYAPTCDCFIGNIETLAWHIPDSSVHTSSETLTLTGNPGTTYSIDLFLTGNMESRWYDDPTVTVVGGGGRFITAASSHSTDTTVQWSIGNVYRIDISDPPQHYYVNQSLPSETSDVLPHDFQVHIVSDGSDAWKLSIQAAGNATITFFATDTEGGSSYYPQFGTITAHVTGSNG